MSERTVMQLVATLKSISSSSMVLTTQESADLREAADLLEQLAEITASNNRVRQADSGLLGTLMSMNKKLSSNEQLILWMGDAPDRQHAAAHAEELVCLTHKEVERGSEHFYSLVLEQAVNSGK